MVDQNRERHLSRVDWGDLSEGDADWGEAAKIVGAIFKSCEGTWKQVRCAGAQ